MEQILRVAYMGTPDFAVPALQALIDSSHEVVCVFTQPPRPKGRGHKVQPSPVHILADEHDIPVHTPRSLKKTWRHRLCSPPMRRMWWSWRLMA